MFKGSLYPRKGKGYNKGYGAPVAKGTGKASFGGALNSSPYAQHHRQLYELEYSAEKAEIQRRTNSQSRESLQAAGYGVSGLEANVERSADPNKPTKACLMLPEPPPVQKVFQFSGASKVRQALEAALTRWPHEIVENVKEGQLSLRGWRVEGTPALHDVANLRKGAQVTISKPSSRPTLPYLSEIAVGRCVLISDNEINAVHPDDMGTALAEVLAISRREISVKLIEKSTLPRGSGLYRLDAGPNKVAYDRIVGVLSSISQPVLASCSLGLLQRSEPLAPELFKDVAQTAERAMMIDLSQLPLSNPALRSAASSPAPDGSRPWKVFGKTPQPSKSLNDSQSAAQSQAVGGRRKLTLVQGPPGTGKTSTALEIVCGWLRAGRGPILATAFSNQGVDNLAEGLDARGVKVVRVGSHERELNCAFEVMFGKYQNKMYYLRQSKEASSGSRPMSKGKGKGKGKDESKGMWDIYTEGTDFEEMVKFLRGCDVVCATCIGVGMSLLNPREGPLDFPYQIIDEAAQIIEPAVLLPMAKGSAQVVMVGDQCQLPATVLNRDAEARGLGVSMFARLVAAGCDASMLNVQYRMHSSIASFSAAEFYRGMLHNGVRDESRRPPKLHALLTKATSFVHCDGRERNHGTSKANVDEATCVAHIVENLVAQGTKWWDIGIITPYTAQVATIQKELGRVTGDGWYAAESVSSVDSYQGSECNVVLISLVRANEDGRVGFLEDWRRLNVALTRAKYRCVIIGHLPTLLGAARTEVWRHWVQHHFKEDMTADLVQWTGSGFAHLTEDSAATIALAKIVPDAKEKLRSKQQSVGSQKAKGKGGKSHTPHAKSGKDKGKGKK